MRLETNIQYLPIAYRCAIARLDNTADRTLAQLREYCDLYAATYPALDGMVEGYASLHAYYTQSACAIAAKRFGLSVDETPPTLDLFALGAP
jgi:hypothetical protein